jgi:tripartite-type tricarboxylate transporter receptor subunit TctC
LAVASKERVPNVPLPTAIESGVLGYVTSNWWGLAAPYGAPQPVLERIYRAVLAVLADKQTHQQLQELGFTAGGEPPQKVLEDTKVEATIWGETISRGKLAVE